MSEIKKVDYKRKFRRYMIEKHDNVTLEEITTHSAPYSSVEASKAADKAVKKLSDALGKTSQKLIKGMIDDIKAHKYSPLDLIKSLNSGVTLRAHDYELDFLKGLWSRASNRFRKYMPKGKMTF
mgnify:FL=1|tara:strand:+ start:4259 stop:4630 length:372 start_codon:yes stop_codon:yes gene_type:complete